MKQNINTPVAVAIVAIAAIVILGGLYYKFLYQKTYTAQETMEAMRKGLAMQRQQMQQRYGQQSGPQVPGTPSGR